MKYQDQDFWTLPVELPDNFKKQIHYYYTVQNQDGLEIPDGEEKRIIEFSKENKTLHFTIIDTWIDAGDFKNVYYTKAFKVLAEADVTQKKQAAPQEYTHEFRIKAPFLPKNKSVCLCGSTRNLKNWNKQDPILLTKKGDWYFARIAFDNNEWPASYKYGIYNLSENTFEGFEDGVNRTLRQFEIPGGKTILHDGFINLYPDKWRGAGANIPVFSLRTNKSFGTGEFTDLKLLVDWAGKTGIALIQLLPINDTSAQNNWMDSYPYAAISSFALHPLYINLGKVAGKKGAAITNALKKKQKQLNSLPELDYEQVMKFKMSALHELFDILKNDLKKIKGYADFVKQNRHWLVPYAAFSHLKDKYKTADFNLWKQHAVFNEESIQKLVAPGNKEHNKIEFYYFVQYHLHSQLREISNYAHKHKIILKGDIPIGIYRYSCDAWQHPELFNMDEQAGAPPDGFALTGQNWGFPIYNWEVMKKDNFKWWRDRFDHLSKYFDAFRIDHILGFFRIWSIPVEQTEGIMGRFKPAIPVNKNEFEQNGIPFDYDRFCKPFITPEILKEIFKGEVDEATEKLLNKNENGTYSLKEEVSTERRASAYLTTNDLLKFQKGIFRLIGNVILFDDVKSGEFQFHFRFGVENTSSFKNLDPEIQPRIKRMYIDYFFNRQNYFWQKKAMEKLPLLKRSTDMLVCGEDLGMVPQSVPVVMSQLGILSLEVERMPKVETEEFFNPAKAHYLSVVTPSTHDMSTLREWWEEDPAKTQKFYNQILKQEGNAPSHCDQEIIKEIIARHLTSPAMFSIFLLQDLMAMDKHLTVEDPSKERINIPSAKHHYWRYRIPVSLETLLDDEELNTNLRKQIEESGRLQTK